MLSFLKGFLCKSTTEDLRQLERPPRLKAISSAQEALQVATRHKRSLQTQKLLGEGSYGQVRLLGHWAVKSIYKSQPLHHAKGESLALEQAHPNIVQAEAMAIEFSGGRKQIIASIHERGPGLGACITHIAYPLAVNGDLFNFLDVHNTLSIQEAAFMIVNIFAGIRELHRQRIYHRDLKLENVLLDQRRRPMITDFGLAARFEEDDRTKEAPGTPEYMSPEMYRRAFDHDRTPHNGSGDLWALGVMGFELGMGCHPFPKTGTVQELSKKIIRWEQMQLRHSPEDMPKFIEESDSAIQSWKRRTGLEITWEDTQHPRLCRLYQLSVNFLIAPANMRRHAIDSLDQMQAEVISL